MQNESSIQPLTEERYDAGFGDIPYMWIFKHSPTCPISLMARREVIEFAKDTEIPIFQVDVLAQRPLSQYIAKHVGIRHESPQILLIQQGVPIWDASHGAIRVKTLKDQVLQHRGV